MPGLGVGEILIVACICGVLVVGLIALGLVVWLISVGQKTHGDLADLNTDDHPHYLTVGRGDPRYAGIQHDHRLSDLSDIDAAAAQEGDVLVRSGEQWAGRSVHVSGETPFARTLVKVRRITPRTLECWFTLDAPGNRAEVIELPVSALQVFRETQTGPKFLAKVSIDEIEHVRRNLFHLRLRQESEFLRIKFDLVNIPVSGDRSIKSFAQEFGLRFVGQAGDSTVTVHFQVIGE